MAAALLAREYSMGVLVAAAYVSDQSQQRDRLKEFILGMLSVLLIWVIGMWAPWRNEGAARSA